MYSFSRSASTLRALSSLVAQSVTGFSPFLCDQLLRVAEDPVFVVVGGYYDLLPEHEYNMLYQTQFIGRSVFVYELGPNSKLHIDIFYECSENKPGQHYQILFGLVRITGGKNGKWGSITMRNGVNQGGTRLCTFVYEANYVAPFTPIVILTLDPFVPQEELHEFFLNNYRE